MGKTAKMVKRSREAEAALSIETKLKGIFSSTDGEPAEKLIGASALWDELGSALESVPDFFAQVKPFVGSLDASDEQDKELKELYEEYAAKSGEELNDEVKGVGLDEDPVELIEKSPDFFAKFSCVVATDLPEQVHILKSPLHTALT